MKKESAVLISLNHFSRSNVKKKKKSAVALNFECTSFFSFFCKLNLFGFRFDKTKHLTKALENCDGCFFYFKNIENNIQVHSKFFSYMCVMKTFGRIQHTGVTL